jgi:hypothetical protein
MIFRNKTSKSNLRGPRGSRLALKLPPLPRGGAGALLELLQMGQRSLDEEAIFGVDYFIIFPLTIPPKSNRKPHSYEWCHGPDLSNIT